MKFKFIAQHDQMDCGPACLAMIAKKHGKNYPLNYLRANSFITREGVSLLGISEAAKSIGFKVFSMQLGVCLLKKQKNALPCILHWNKNHFVVLRKITRNLFTKKYYYHIADPAHGLIKITEERFKKSWLSKDIKGVALFLEPSKEFHKKEAVKQEGFSVKFYINYLKVYSKQLSLLFILLLIGSGLNLIFPFLTEALIDRGVIKKDLNFIFIILLAQVGLFLGTITIEIFRNWIILHIGTSFSIEIISNFLKKMVQLPISFFDTKTMGDFNQRIQDNNRIEEFLTSQSISTFFSIITFSVFFGVLWYYDYNILLTYLVLTIASISWSFYWFKKRMILDYHRFQGRSENQESIYEMLNGITEMKLNQFENFKIKEWESIQNKLFKINIKILKLDQLQLSGFNFINELKNITVTFLAATYVVGGNMTLGKLLSISYIIGQMNSPVNQLVDFFRSLQDAKLSFARLNEIQNHPEEEREDLKSLSLKENEQCNSFPKGIKLKDVSFQYEGPNSPFVLRDVNLFIPEGKITAIVGASGSGKTTLLKLLLNFYAATEGDIYYNNDNILSLSPKSIRENCGIVMQDGYIFSDTIERNIATGCENINRKRLHHSVKIANILSFIQSLPLGYDTKIGASGNGISGGQKQRILIARAVYKNPHYIYFDEATSALDAENEKIIHDNLQTFFNGKTVVIIAHRLSTVKKADQIVVLKQGKIVEIGTHEKLVSQRNTYFNLVKNQLELGA